ncbi:MAG TPA: hypothetical protein VIU64_08545 [Polyangia bacterium]
MTLQRASKIAVVSLALLAAPACSKSGPAIPPGDGGDAADGGAPDGESAPAGPSFAVGARHDCAIFGGGAVRCWGDNSAGQLGRPPPFDPLAAYSVDLGAGRRAAGIYAGQFHTCAILDDFAVKCWGDNSFAQLGLGDLVNRGDGMLAMGDNLPVVDLGTGARAVTLALGGAASCALLKDGRVKCWGDPYQGATGHGDIEPRGGVPGTMGDNLPSVDLGSRDGVPFEVKALEAFEYHSFCAILDGGGPSASGLKCWGSNDYCELGIGSHEGGLGAEPTSLGNALPWIDIGTTAAGTVRKAVAMAAGFQSICVLGDDGVVKCWGTNRSGELGLGTTGDPRSCVPEDMGNAGLVALPAPAKAIAARREHVCALLTTGQVTCWGVNTYGELGTGDTNARLSPSEPLVFESGFTPARLALGDDHACALSADDRVKCWGSNQYGQLGAPADGDRLAPGPDLQLHGPPVAALAAGADHTCALLARGVVKCWGRNTAGQLGLGDTTNRGDGPNQMGDALPAVELGATATAVAAGAAHTCARLASGAVLCWGANESGQLGQGSTMSSLVPGAPVNLPGPAVTLAAGDDFSCATLMDGRVFCWGAGGRGQLGTGDRTDRPAPATAVALPGKAQGVAAGGHHACARLENQTVACWGANDVGQLGLGDQEDRPRPAVVTLGSAHALAVASRQGTTCALLDDHRVTCWGDNTRGQLGLGDARERDAPPPTPLDLGTARRASAIAVGAEFACALLDTRQAKCWGDNLTNQLGAPLRGLAYGDGVNEMGDFLAAAVQGGGRAVTALAAGRGHACALLDTGDLRCWGDNAQGQLGVGDAVAHSLFDHPSSVVDLGTPAP